MIRRKRGTRQGEPVHHPEFPFREMKAELVKGPEFLFREMNAELVKRKEFLFGKWGGKNQGVD